MNASTIALDAIKTGCTQPYSFVEIRDYILSLKRAEKSLRQIAREDFGGRITHAVVQRIIEGHEPHDPRVRSALGLPAYQSVVVVTGGVIPLGTQVYYWAVCDCGMPYASNHPARKKCFYCSPPRKRKKV